VDEELTVAVSGRFAARGLEERVGEGVADRWPDETEPAGMEERPERPEIDIFEFDPSEVGGCGGQGVAIV